MQASSRTRSPSGRLSFTAPLPRVSRALVATVVPPRSAPVTVRRGFLPSRPTARDLYDSAAPTAG